MDWTDKRATIIDVARHAGVSTASVSKVLRDAYGVSDEMKLRVKSSMEALAYRPHRFARGMRGRTFTVGLIVPDIENPFMSLLATGLTEVLSPAGFELIISPSGHTEKAHLSAVDALIGHQMDGLVLVAPLMSAQNLERLGRSLPVTVVGSHLRSDVYDSIAGDDALGSELVLEHLHSLGHRRIAFVANTSSFSDISRPESIRLRGYREGMQKRGLDAASHLVTGLWNMAGGRRAAALISQLPSSPTAVFAGADVVAFGLMSAWWEQGIRVPDDFSLVGYDNSYPSAIGPVSLTSVDQSGRQLGARAAQLLLERIGGRVDSHHELLAPTLVPRTSTSEAP